MEFEREAPGVYKYHRKKVFMKIENETIVIRVGGGFLTIDEFIDFYCKSESDREYTRKATNLVYAGKCAGSSQFKTFYFEQKEVDEKKEQSEKENVSLMLPKPSCTEPQVKKQNQALNSSIIGTPANKHFEKEAIIECSNFNATLNARINSPNKKIASPVKQLVSYRR